jgi:hypothetical protein
MAIKGLQAMNAASGSQSGAATATMAAVPPAPPPPPAPERELTEEERYAAELDSAFDDYDALPRVETPHREPDETVELGADRPTTPRGSARQRSAARRGATPVRSSDEDDDLYGAPRRSALSPLALGLLALIVVFLLGFLIYNLVFNRGSNVARNQAATTTAIAARTAAAGGAAGQPTSALPGGGGILTATATLTETPPLTSTTAPEQPTPVAPGPNPAPVANPNLQTVDIGAQLQANGWTYTYPDPSYVLVLGKQVGSFTAQGTYVHVLVWVTNNTGADAPLPANFFALKDSNNNVYTGAPDVANAAVQRGINADRSMGDPIPANGVPTSVYLVFDVASGAQNVALFAAGNNGQGWVLLPSVP